MRLRHSTAAFPYPVLTPGKDSDYTDEARFSCRITDLDSGKETFDQKRVALKYQFDLSEPEIERLIEEGLATYAVQVESSRTFYRCTKYCDSEAGAFEIDVDSVEGDVQFIPFIVTLEGVENFRSDSFHDEIKGTEVSLKPGSKIAIGKAFIKTFSKRVLTHTSVLKFELDGNLDPPATYRIDVRESEIIVYLGKELHEFYNEVGENSDIHYALLSQICKDAVLMALIELRDEDGADQYVWRDVLKAAFQNAGISGDIESLPKEAEQLNQFAQILVEGNCIKKCMEMRRGNEASD